MATLYTYPDFWRSYPVLIAAQYSGLQLKVISGPPEFEPQSGCRTDHFLAKFPFGKVPAFEGENGFHICESNAIAHYVGTDALRGIGPKDSALVQQWVSYADGAIIPAVANWVYPTLGASAYNKQASEKAQADLQGALSFLNEHLQTRTFLVGERVSLADITLVCALLLLYKQVLDPSLREPFSNVTRWFCSCVHQPQFSAVLGKVKLCEKAAQYKVKDVEAPKKKEQKTEEEEEADTTEEAMAAEPKTEDPFAALPNSPFVLDEFKRQYSNEDPQTVALPHFWEHFDRDGWSLWYAEYKYPGELGEVLLSSNLIAGMFQRLEGLRKNSFASMAVFGKDGDGSISGVWLFRGQQLAFELCDDWKVDYGSYSWRKLDPDSEESKTLIKEYLCWEGEFKHVGKPFNQGKIFK
ncbi:elongation factor 1-gamma-like isoform X2 [Polyodon spathula]|uniref:elongation factor 1-gamma-like isoform X2 n=1 Tax=Polyodon spathula TaxID=7913 RepID=UPI001B7E778F|nr:elongation factor 1-gamma-like isoform X2 [Polyodon spathula]